MNILAAEHELPALVLEQDPIHKHKDVLAHTIAVIQTLMIEVESAVIEAEATATRYPIAPISCGTFANAEFR